MHIDFCGAAGTVTGSCHLLDTGTQRILVDCGRFQGGREIASRNDDPFPFDPAALDLVVLTHAHADHIGRLPALIQAGYRGAFAATRSTAELVAIALLDTARHDDSDHDAELAHDVWKRISIKPRFGERVDLGDALAFTLHPAGHLLGAASVRFEVGSKTIGFSGDIGRASAPILGDPEPFPPVDVLVIESTYGDRDHKTVRDTSGELFEVFERALADGGNILVPAFALGRAQDVLYHINDMAESGLLGTLRVILDSPLAAKIREVFGRHRELFDEEARALLAGGDDPLDFSALEVIERHKDSEALHYVKGGLVVVAAGGMCEGGRILGHLRANLPRANADVVFLSYQAEGTLGRALVEGAKEVEIDGRRVAVRAKVHTLGGFSAHAGRTELLDWARRAASPGAKVFVVHGESRASASLANGLVLAGFDAVVPRHRERCAL